MTLRVAMDARSLASPVVRGMDRYIIGLVEQLASRDVEVTLVHRDDEPVHPDHQRRLGVPLLSIADRSGLSWEQISLPRALRRGRFDLYHAPAEHGVPLLAPCPTVLTLHSATAFSYDDLIRSGKLPGPLSRYLGDTGNPRAWTLANLYWRAQVHRATHIVAPSAFARDEIVRLLRIRERYVSAIPLAVDRSFASAPRDDRARGAILDRLGVRGPYLLYVGGYEPHKNVAGLIQAFGLVRAVRPDLLLVVVGSRSTNTMPAPAPGVVQLTGLGPELPALYDGAELFVSLSWRESFGLPALEAMTRGTAVVASAWGAAPEIVRSGGRLVDPRDPAAFRDAVLALLDDPSRSVAARADAARFSWDETADATVAIYRRLSGG